MEHIIPRALALRQTRDMPKQQSCVKPRLLNIDEVCEILQISKHGLYSLLRARELKSLRVGKRRLIRLEELLRFIELREGEAGA